MKKFLAYITFVFLAFFATSSLAASHHHAQSHAHNKSNQETVTLHFFWSQDCPHCVAAHPFIDKLKAEYPWLVVREHEISGHPENSRLFEKMAHEHGKETSFVPTFFVGDSMIVGYTSADTTGKQIREAVLAAHK